jgi:ferredoxin
VVDTGKCTACGDCVEACPKDLFVLQPVDHRLLVQCKNLVSGDEALASCNVACTACGKCVLDGAPGLISVASGVAVVDYDRIALAEERVVTRCPTGAIVWLKGAEVARNSTLRGSAQA